MIIFVNEPVASIVAVVVEPSGSVIVTGVCAGSYPVPDTVTELPTPPLVGETVVVGDTVNEELAVLVPSEEDIECEPAVELGIVIIFVNEPVESAVAVTWEPSGSVIVMVAPVAYPVPDMVTVLPTAPLVGDITVLA